MNLKKYLSRNSYNILIGVGLLWICIVFYYFLNKQILPYTNRFDDEGYYLRDSITIWSKLKENGYFRTLIDYFCKNFEILKFMPGPSTNLGLLAATFMYFSSPGRAAALVVNILGFSTLIIVLVGYLKKVIKHQELLLIPLIFVYFSRICFVGPGDIFDFRLDFFGVCLYGITICCLLYVLDDPPRSISQIVIKLFPIFICSIFRFILVIYLIAPCSYFLYLIYKKYPDSRRTFNLSLLFLICLLMLNVAWSFDFLKNYYWVQQQSTLERDFHEQFYINYSLLSYVFYYPKTFLTVYLGKPLLLIIFISIMLLFLLNFKIHKLFIEYISENKEKLIFLILTIMSPLGILSVNYLKTPQVIGVLVTPVVILLVLVIDVIPWSKRARTFNHRILLSLFILGAFIWPVRLLRERSVDLSEISNINKLFEETYNVSKSFKTVNSQIYIAFLDSLPDVDHNTFTIWAAERKGGDLFLPELLVARLPFSIKENRIISELSKAYMVVVPKDWSHLEQSKWPVFHDVLNAKNLILTWLKKNATCTSDFAWKGQEYRTCFMLN